MAVSYYTSFLVTDPVGDGLRHVCGVMEFARQLCASLTEAQLESIIARGLDVRKEDVQLMCWSTLH